MSARLPAGLVVDPDDEDVADPWHALGIEKTPNTLTYISDVQSAVAEIEQRLATNPLNLLTSLSSTIPNPSASSSNPTTVFAPPSDDPSTLQSTPAIVSEKVRQFEKQPPLTANTQHTHTASTLPSTLSNMCASHTVDDIDCPPPELTETPSLTSSQPIAEVVQRFESPPEVSTGPSHIDIHLKPIAPTFDRCKNSLGPSVEKVHPVDTIPGPIAPVLQQFEVPAEAAIPVVEHVDIDVAPIAPVVELFEKAAEIVVLEGEPPPSEASQVGSAIQIQNRDLPEADIAEAHAAGLDLAPGASSELHCIAPLEHSVANENKDALLPATTVHTDEWQGGIAKMDVSKIESSELLRSSAKGSAKHVDILVELEEAKNAGSETNSSLIETTESRDQASAPLTGLFASLVEQDNSARERIVMPTNIESSTTTAIPCSQQNLGIGPQQPLVFEQEQRVDRPKGQGASDCSGNDPKVAPADRAGDIALSLRPECSPIVPEEAEIGNNVNMARENECSNTIDDARERKTPEKALPEVESSSAGPLGLAQNSSFPVWKDCKTLDEMVENQHAMLVGLASAIDGNVSLPDAMDDEALQVATRLVEELETNFSSQTTAEMREGSALRTKVGFGSTNIEAVGLERNTYEADDILLLQAGDHSVHGPGIEQAQHSASTRYNSTEPGLPRQDSVLGKKMEEEAATKGNVDSVDEAVHSDCTTTSSNVATLSIKTDLVSGFLARDPVNNETVSFGKILEKPKMESQDRSADPAATIPSETYILGSSTPQAEQKARPAQGISSVTDATTNPCEQSSTSDRDSEVIHMKESADRAPREASNVEEIQDLSTEVNPESEKAPSVPVKSETLDAIPELAEVKSEEALCSNDEKHDADHLDEKSSVGSSGGPEGVAVGRGEAREADSISLRPPEQVETVEKIDVKECEANTVQNEKVFSETENFSAEGAEAVTPKGEVGTSSVYEPKQNEKEDSGQIVDVQQGAKAVILKGEVGTSSVDETKRNEKEDSGEIVVAAQQVEETVGPLTPNTRSTIPGSPTTPEPVRASTPVSPKSKALDAGKTLDQVSRTCLPGGFGKDEKATISAKAGDTRPPTPPTTRAGASLVSRRSTLTPQSSTGMRDRAMSPPSRRTRLSSATRTGRSPLPTQEPSVRSSSARSDRTPTVRRTLTRLPRVAELPTHDSSATGRARVPRGSTFSGPVPRAKTTLSATTPGRRMAGTQVSPVTPHNGSGAPGNASADRPTFGAGSTSRNQTPLLRRALSFTHPRRSTSAPRSTAVGSEVDPQPSRRPGWNRGGDRQKRQEVALSPNGRRLDRRGSILMSDASRAISPPTRMSKHKPTVPKPFALTGADLHEKAQHQLEMARKKADENERKGRAFKARPMPDFSKPHPKPFVQ